MNRRGVSLLEYFKKLREFVNNHITRKILEEDLNILLEYKKFKQVNKYLKKETLNFIDIEIKRLSVGLTKGL